MRVLFVNTRAQIGADVAVHITLMQHFRPDEVEVHLVTNRNATDLDAMRRSLAPYPHVTLQIADLGHELSAGRPGKLGKILGGLRNLGAMASVLRLSWYVRRHKIDILHTTDRPRDALLSTLLSRLSGCPLLMHLHIMWYPEIGRLTDMALARCAGVLAISQFTRLSLHRGNVPDEKIHTVLNSIDPTAFDPHQVAENGLRRAWNLEDDDLAVGIVARPILWKGHQDLIEALPKVAASFPQVRLVIVGALPASPDDPAHAYIESLRARIDALGIGKHVIWAGWHNDMPAVMGALDLLAVPSWEEPFGLVVTEAMAMERPVVGFCSGALPEIITDGVEGLLTPPRDPEALADGLIALLGDPERRQEMGRRGRTRVLEQFTPQRQCAEVAEVYRKIALRGE